MKQGYIPPERMTKKQLRGELEAEFDRWNYIAAHGCRDPFWPDGMNMNLIRNHIIYYYRFLAEKIEGQLSLLDAGMEMDRPVPPLVPDRYMVRGQPYSNRLDGRNWDRLVWGDPGEYSA